MAHPHPVREPGPQGRPLEEATWQPLTLTLVRQHFAVPNFDASVLSAGISILNLVPADQTSSPKTIDVSVTLSWKPRGLVIPYFPSPHPGLPATWDTVAFSWPDLPNYRAGLYRIRISANNFTWIYIGESANLFRRLSHYRRLHKSRPNSNDSRLSVLIRKALLRGNQVSLDTTSNGRIRIGGVERSLVFHQKIERCLAETAAILQEESMKGEDAWILNKSLDDNGRYIWTEEWNPVDVPDNASPIP